MTQTVSERARRGRPRSFEDEDVLRLTTHLLIEEGLTAVTLPRIAKDLGVSPQAIAQRFESKAGLIASYRLWFNRIVAEDIATIVREAASPLAALCELLVMPMNARMSASHWDDPNIGWILLNVELRRAPQVPPESGEDPQHFMDIVIDLIRRAQAEGTMRAGDPVATAELLIAVVAGGALQWTLQPEGDMRSRLIRYRDVVLAPYLIPDDASA